jgi:hypothetical protein
MEFSHSKYYMRWKVTFIHSVLLVDCIYVHMIRIFNILKAEYLVCILDAEDTEGIALQIYKTKIF